MQVKLRRYPGGDIGHYRFDALPRMGELISLQSKEHRDTYKVVQIEHTCADQAIPASSLADSPIEGGLNSSAAPPMKKPRPHRRGFSFQAISSA